MQLIGQRGQTKRPRVTDNDSDRESLPEPLSYSSRLVKQTSSEREKLCLTASNEQSSYLKSCNILTTKAVGN